jgi:hypothetical protein
MNARRILSALLLSAVLLLPAGCLPAGGPGHPRLVMFVGVDISGSFIPDPRFDDGLDFLARYLYAHLKGLGGLEVPSSLFVGSIGGAKPGEPKTFYPIETFRDRSVEEIRAKLAELFPKGVQNPYTDFNAYFQQVAETLRNRKLVLKPISIVLLSDGVVDVPVPGKKRATKHDIRSVKLDVLERLSRNITLRLIYTDAVTGADWQGKIRRQRVKIWTQDTEVMVLWKDPKIYLAGQPEDGQEKLFKWIGQNVDFGVRSRRVN